MAKQKPISKHQVTSETFPRSGSKNHQFSLLKDRVYSRYRKTTIHAVALKRLNPADHDEILSVLLKSSEDAYNFDTQRLKFDYSTDVAELYSEDEDEYFRLANGPAFERGLLVKYTESGPGLNYPIIEDTRITETLEAPTIDDFIDRVNALTALPILKQVKDGLSPKDSYEKHAIVDGRIAHLQEVE